MKRTTITLSFRWLMLGVVLLTFALRVYQLDAQSLRGDEAISATYANLPVTEMLSISRTAEPHPPLFYLILGVWEKAAGTGEFAVRFWALLAGVLAVPSLYALARQAAGRSVGLLAALLLTVNSFHIWHSQDARSYPWLVLLGIWSSALVWVALRRGGWRWWTGYTVSVAVLFYLHYYALFLVAFHALYGGWLLWRREISARTLLYWGVALATALAALLPWLGASWQYVAHYTGNFTPASPLAVLWRGLLAFGGGLVTDPPHFSAWLAVGATLALLGAIGNWQRQRNAVVFFGLYVALTFTGIALLSLRGLAFTERYLLGALPGYLALAAMGGMWLWRRPRWGKRVFILLLGIFLWQNGTALNRYWFDPALAKAPQWRQAFAYVARHQHPGDILLYDFPEASITYYLDTNAAADFPPYFLMPAQPNPSPAEVDRQMTDLLAGYQRVWFVPVNIGGWDNAQLVETWLTRHGDRLDRTDFHWVQADLYLTPATIETAMIHQPVQFENGLALRGFRVTDKISPHLNLAAQPLDLRLYWTTAAPTTAPLTVFVQLIGPGGLRRGGQDHQPVQGSYPTTDWHPGERLTDRYTVLLEPGAPPGEYQVWVGLYNPQTGERVSVVDGGGNPIADHAVLDVSAVVE